MLDGWTTSSSSTEDEPSHRRPKQHTPLWGMTGNVNQDQKSLYKEYSWLFGRRQ